MSDTTLAGSATSAPKQQKAKPRYQVIGDTLMAELARGDYDPGSCLPTELELCTRFDASRFTIRKALDVLRDLGLVERRSGVGTIVIARRPKEQIVQTLNSFEDLFQYPSETYRQPLETRQVTTSAELALMLRASPGQDWTRLRAMRMARRTEAPISWLEAYVRPDVADVLKQPNPAGVSLLSQIETTHGHTAENAQVEMSVTRVDAEKAGLLAVEEGSPALIILRRYFGRDGNVYLLTYSVHPENRFSLNFELEKQ